MHALNGVDTGTSDFTRYQVGPRELETLPDATRRVLKLSTQARVKCLKVLERARGIEPLTFSLGS